MRPRTGVAAAAVLLSAAGVLAATTASAGATAARPADRGHHGSAIEPGDLLVSQSNYQADPGLVPGATVLPPGAGSAGAAAIASGRYPQVFNMCVLAGFPTALAKSATDASDYPFGIWFASPTTLYVADEGSGDNAYDAATGTYSAAATAATAGLQKWVLNSSTGQWQLAYTVHRGLNLGTPYTVAGYPAGINSVTGLPWSPATDGLRNITGRVNKNGTVTIWAVTSTVSGGGDQGADPNKLVSVTDDLNATTLPGGEAFQTVVAPGYGKVVRGVSFTPGTTVSASHGR